MAERSVQFTVADDNHRSAIWECWSHSGSPRDVYLAITKLGRDAFHISFHESRQCHIKFPKKDVSTHAPPDSRFRRGPYVERWVIPTELPECGSPLFEIFVPHGAVASTRSWSDEPRDLVVMPPPDVGSAVRVTLSLHPMRPNSTTASESTPVRGVGMIPIDDVGELHIGYEYCETPRLPSGMGPIEMIRGEAHDLLKTTGTRGIFRIPGAVPPAVIEGVLATSIQAEVQSSSRRGS